MLRSERAVVEGCGVRCGRRRGALRARLRARLRLAASSPSTASTRSAARSTIRGSAGTLPLRRRHLARATARPCTRSRPEPSSVYSDAIAVRQPGGHEFSYWHVRATVPEHSFVKKGAKIGVVRFGFGHVHFAEFDGHTYVNPLRRGGLAPFRRPDGAGRRADRRRPVERDDEGDRPGLRPAADRAARPRGDRRSGRRSSCAGASLENGAPVVPWTVAVDFRTFHPPQRVRPRSTRRPRGRTGRIAPARTCSGSRTASASSTACTRSRCRRGTRAETPASPRASSRSTGDQSLNTMKLASR